MKTTNKLATLAGVVLTGSMLVGQTALAQDAICSETFAPGAGGTLDDFAAVGSCRDQDKLYTYISDSNDVNPTTEIDVFFEDDPDIPDVHLFTIGAIEGPNSLELVYSIEIVDDPATPEIDESLKTFAQVSLDSDVPSGIPGVRVTKLIEGDGYSDTLTSTNGSPGGTSDVPAGIQFLTITDTIEIDTGAGMLSATNTFTQNPVPEPMSLALMGIGLAGLAGFRRRKAA